jgi:tagatose-6-phosphate ketose/aldose isomerase
MSAGQVITMSESVLGLRHGPMAALNAETLVVCYLSSDPRVRPYEEDLLREIGQKQLVSTRVAVAENAGSADLAEQWLVHPLGVDDEYRGPVDVMFGQLLGLFFSLRFDLKPDTPSPTGAITRVVHRINIHS